VREAWLGEFDQGGLSKRFLAGAVSFGTLMPMRAIPFRVVCLLGMNDGDYPRARPPMDFDLMSRAGAWRPGDRSRREDDRYLFLEALLSARDALHIGWVGRSARDNAERAPSVLVGQLRDYLHAAWQGEGGGYLLERVTVEHPLQPFSRAYFHAGDPRLFTYATEWRLAHDGSARVPDAVALSPITTERPIGLAVLRRFLRHPVREFFQARLGVRFDLAETASDELEPFVVDSLGRFAMTDQLLRAALRVHDHAGQAMEAEAARLQRSGALPMGGFATPVRLDIEGAAQAVFGRFVAERRQWPRDAGKREIHLEVHGVVIEDWLADLRADDEGRLAIFLLSPSNVLHADGSPRAHRLVMSWIDHLVAQAAGYGVVTRYIGPDATIVLSPMDREDALRMLGTLVDAWREGMARPLPVAVKTALAWLLAPSPDDAAKQAREAYAPAHDRAFGEIDGDPYLTRAYPTFDRLLAAGLADWLSPYRDFLAALRVEVA